MEHHVIGGFGYDPAYDEEIWDIRNLRGTLHFAYLPRTVAIFDVSFPKSEGLIGNVSLSNLPSNLYRLSLSGIGFQDHWI